MLWFDGLLMLTYFDLALALVMCFTAFMWFAILAMLRPLKKMGKEIPDTGSDRVLLVIPCLYHDRLEENLAHFSRLKHPNLRAVYVTGTEHEPAADVIKKICSEYAHCHHVVAGEAKLCSQKNKNLIAAIQSNKDFAADFYLFCDDDCHPKQEHWIAHFTAPLKSPKIGAVTSFRHVHLPENPSISDFLYFFATTYQRASLRLTSSFVWGGAFALSRKIFEENKLEEKWGSTAVDDIVTSHVIARSGTKIKFVQECMLHEKAAPTTVRHFQAWMTRQFQYLYFYEPWGYWLSFVMLTSTLLSFFLLPIQLYTGWLESSMEATAICLFSICCLGGTIASLAQGMKITQKILCTFAIPLVIGSTVLGLINCMLTDMITWKHKAYRIASDGSISEVINLVPTLRTTPEKDLQKAASGSSLQDIS
jgi:ceramide glucosyltransferase